MFHQKTGLSFQSTITVLLFCLLQIHFCRGQSQVIGPSQPIVATIGDDIILPSYLDPAHDATTLTVEWTRPDLNPRFIYVSRSGQELKTLKNPSYEGRTSLFIDEMKHGNISLKISKVKRTDAGRYRCFIPVIRKDTFMKLVVVSGAVSQPVVTLAGIDGKGGVELECKSAGWYPEPEVLWLDGDGNLLSAGPTETIRGSDDLYNVSSRVTVEKKHGNKFTCRVQQNNINQTREALIQVTDDFFIVHSSSTSTIVGSAVCLVVSIILLILAVVLFVHMRRQHRTKRKEVQVKFEEGLELMSDNTMSMKTPEKKKQPETKQMKNEYDDIIKQLQQEKEERKKAENEVKILTSQLEKVKNKQTELQSLQEEKKKIQEDLKNRITVLNTKNTELEKIREESAKSNWLSLSGSTKQKKEKEEKRIQTDIENLIKQLMTKNMEFQNKDKECEEKQLELKKLLDEQQKMETELLIEKQQLGTNTIQLQDEKNKWTETERKLKTLIQNMIRELDGSHHNTETDVENQLKELEKKLNEKKKQWKETEGNWIKELNELMETYSETNNQLEQEKQKNETLRNHLKQTESSFPSPDGRKQPPEDVSMTASSTNERHQEQPAVDHTNDPQQEEMRSMAGSITVVEINERGSYIHLKNISSEAINLGGWKLELQINNGKPAIYTIQESLKFQAGQILCISSRSCYGEHYDDVKWMWSNMKNWNPGDKLQIKLISNNRETFRLL